MRLSSVRVSGVPALVARREEHLVDVTSLLPALGDSVGSLLDAAALRSAVWSELRDAVAGASGAALLDASKVTYRPVVPRPGKIICLGLNYVDHAAEAKYEKPSYPVTFLRTTTSLLAHAEPLVIPKVSEQLDYEAELAAVIGKGGRNIAREDALAHVAGYACFNDASIRDYQLKSHQWTVGKNFDATGGFGPELVTADELPPGASGLAIRTVVGDEILQSANTKDMIFDVAETIATLSVAMSLEPGDVLVMGTPGGVGLARKPQRWLRAGETVRIEIEKVGTLSNAVVAEV